MNELSKRIYQIMQDKKMNATQFSNAIGISRGNMSHIKLGRYNPSADMILKIINRFDDINPNWLLTGKEPMKITDDRTDNLINSRPSDHRDDRTLKNQPFNRIHIQEGEKTKSLPSAGNETDLFAAEGDIHAAAHRKIENRRAEEVKQVDNDNKIIEKEIVIYKEKPVKSIDKLVIFFSDRTFETFIPEIND